MTRRVRSSPTSHRAEPGIVVVLALAVGIALAGCVPDTHTAVKEGARRHLGWNVDTSS